MLEFVGSSYPLTSDALKQAASNIGVDAAEIWTVFDVEVEGCGFLSDRRPQILYERHIFSKLTDGQFDDGDISDPSPGGYGATGAHQYDRLAKALQHNRIAALQSASWGLGQILGECFREAGFNDVESMVAKALVSEEEHVNAFIRYLKTRKLDAPLRSHQWTDFARAYNGKNYAIHNYDGRLNASYQKFSNGGLPNFELRAAQLYLTFLRFHPGPVDGQPGKLTASALTQFQQQAGLAVTGALDPNTTSELKAQVTKLSAEGQTA